MGKEFVATGSGHFGDEHFEKSLSKPLVSRVDGKHRLHCGPLEKMFEGKKGYVPLKVVSINGITGKGKSLMINLLASFLQQLEKPIESPWESSNEEVKGMKFEPLPWNGDRTLGMHMWHRPFMIPTEAGKVAILLIDCQGSNGLKDSNENIEQEIQLLSLALADVQLINVDECIDSTTLGSLKNLVESMNNNCQDPEFPDELIFLYRNYAPRDTEYHGEKKAAFADAVVGCDDAHQEALRWIQNKFKSETTFTFPHPGAKVAGANMGARLPLRVKDIPSDFIASLKSLAHRIVDGVDGQWSDNTGHKLIRRFRALKEPVESGNIMNGLTTASNIKRENDKRGRENTILRGTLAVGAVCVGGMILGGYIPIPYFTAAAECAEVAAAGTTVAEGTQLVASAAEAADKGAKVLSAACTTAKLVLGGGMGGAGVAALGITVCEHKNGMKNKQNS